MGTIALAALTAAVAAASPGPRDPALDLEAELRRIAPVPPPALEVRFTSLNGPEYALEDLSLELDGQAQSVPTAAQILAGAPVFAGSVAPGRHQLTARVTLVARFGSASYRTGYRFKLGKRIAFQAQKGLLHQVELKAQRQSSLAWEQSLDLAVSRSERMIAALESGDLPSPPRLPPPAFAGGKVDDAQASEVAAAFPKAASAPVRAPAIRRATPPDKPAPPALASASKDPASPTPASAASLPPALPVTLVQALVEAELPSAVAPTAPAPIQQTWLERAGAPLVASALAVGIAWIGVAALRRRRRAGPGTPPTARGTA